MGEYPRQSWLIKIYAAKERNKVRAIGGSSGKEALMPKSVKAIINTMRAQREL
jgi:hypothetical protein